MTEAPTRTPTILVVEDVQETREAIAALLRHDGYRVDLAQGEDDAVERARWRSPDLILVSIGGTTEHVLGVARRIRARAGVTDRIPVVIFSIATIPEGAEQQIEGNVYLTVPDSFNQLRSLLTRVLQAGIVTH